MSTTSDKAYMRNGVFRTDGIAGVLGLTVRLLIGAFIPRTQRGGNQCERLLDSRVGTSLDKL